jgi:hypothetical protein
VDEDVRRAITAGTSIVLTGPALAGKTRTALQAVREAVPDAAVIAPRGQEELTALLAADPPLQISKRRRVLWLDDLPQYVESLDQAALDRLPVYLPPGRSSRADPDGDADLVVVATVRDDEWGAMLGSTGAAGQLARGLAARASVRLVPPTDEVFEREAKSIFPQDAFPDGPGAALATSGIEDDLPERPPPYLEPAGWKRWDRTAMSLAGVIGLAAVAILSVLVLGGFSKPTPPALPVQVAELQRDAASHGEYMQPLGKGDLDLHGTGQASRLFVYTSAGSRSAPSDEIRIYDDEDGWLKPAFRFRPAEPGVRFRFRRVQDIDADGAAEVVGGYAAPDARAAMIPFAIEWRPFAKHYRMVPLDLGPPSLGPARMPKRFRIQAGLYRERYTTKATIRDATSHRRLTGHRVQDFVIASPPRIVAAYFLRPPFDLTKDPALYEIHAAILTAGPTPKLRRCELAGSSAPRMEIMLSERSQEKALAETWAKATADRYCALVSD